MRLTVTIGLLAVATGFHLPVRADETVKTLTVLIVNRSVDAGRVLGRAQSTACRMFAEIGLRIEWREATPKSMHALTSKQPILITITDQTAYNFHPGALAVAQP